MSMVMKAGAVALGLLVMGCSSTSVQVYTGTVPRDVSAKEFREMAKVKCAKKNKALLDTIYTPQSKGDHHVVVMCD